MPTIKDLKFILSMIVICLLAVGAVLAVQEVLKWREGFELSQAQTQGTKAATDILGDGRQADEDRDKVDKGIAQGRTQFNEDMRTARHEPEIADRADRPVPLSVRNAFRKRRLARDRAGCAGAECRAGPETSAPP